MKKVDLFKKRLDDLRGKNRIHILMETKYIDHSQFFIDYAQHVVNDIPYGRSTYLDINDINVDQIKGAYLLEKLILSRKRTNLMYTLLINNAQEVKPSYYIDLYNENDESKMLNKIYDINTLLLNLYNTLEYDIYVILNEKVCFKKDFLRKMNNRIEYIYLDTFLPSDYSINTEEFIKMAKKEIKNEDFDKTTKLILKKYADIKRIELLPKLIQYIAQNVDIKLGIQSLTKYLKKLDSLTSPYNTTNLCEVIDKNFMFEKVYYKDMNNDKVIKTYFKFYTSNLNKLFLFIGDNHLDKEKIYKNLIFMKFISKNIQINVGNYIRYAKINGVTIKRKYEYDYIFVYNHENYALNFENGNNSKYNDLLQLIGYKKIYVTLKNIDTNIDENNVINLNINKFFNY